MGEKKTSSSSYRFGCVGTGLGLASLVGFFTLGPIDLVRTAYNSIVGDVPLIRSRAVEYCRRNIQRENPSLNTTQVEGILAGDLKYSLQDKEKVDAQEVRMLELWDATEDHATGWYERWIWPSLPKD